MTKSATISECGRYRYHLQRVWDESMPRVCFIMLNPSTADANIDDPTIRRCIGFAKSWGYGGIDVVNLYAFRATKPAELWKQGDPIGPENDISIYRIIEDEAVRLVVAAWGRNAKSLRVSQVRSWIATARLPLHQIGEHKFPRHPLYLGKHLQPVRVTPC